MSAPRAMWKGALRLGKGAPLPVSLHAAVEDRTVRFQLLHDRDKKPVRQRLIDPASEEVVSREDLRKGLETRPGTFALLDEDDLRGLQPKATRDIRVTRFVPATAIAPQWYERPYYLSPASDEKRFAALLAAIEQSERVGIARWVMRGRAYVGALAAGERVLTLTTLRHCDEIIEADSLPSLQGAAITAREQAMASQLIGLLDAEYDPGEFRDEYRKSVEKLIAARAHGRAVRLPAKKSRGGAPANLDSALERSLGRAAKPRSRRRKSA